MPDIDAAIRFFDTQAHNSGEYGWRALECGAQLASEVERLRVALAGEQAEHRGTASQLTEARMAARVAVDHLAAQRDVLGTVGHLGFAAVDRLELAAGRGVQSAESPVDGQR